MYKNILVPLDGSELAETALAEAVKLAKLSNADKLVLFTVITIPSILLSDTAEGLDIMRFKQGQFQKAQKYLAEVSSRITPEGINVVPEIMEGVASDLIVDYSMNHEIDVIVIATHGYTGLKKLMLGSVALSVLHDSPVPVLLIRPAARSK